jgi:hypothetical protein
MKIIIIELVKEVAPIISTALVAAVIRHWEKCKVKNYYRDKILKLQQELRELRNKGKY